MPVLTRPVAAQGRIAEPRPELDLTPAAGQAVVDALTSGTWGELNAQLTQVGNCAQPIRLRGRSDRVDTGTGEVVSSWSPESGQLLVRCGTRHADLCPACSRTYAADTFQMIKAGVVGGKGVPASVVGHPLIFATLTAPSFGHVHRAGRDGKTWCRPRTKKTLCAHGQPTWCMNRHSPGDTSIGQPLCGDCYDYQSHLSWQWAAPELWRRTTMGIRRALAARLGVANSRLGERVRVNFAKVAEYQSRGVIHFHCLVRLDGPQGFTGPPIGASVDDLTSALRTAITGTSFDALGIDGQIRTLGWGAQYDLRTITDPSITGDDALTAEHVAGYLAKYATKSLRDTIDPQHPNSHAARLRSTWQTLIDRVARAQYRPNDLFTETEEHLTAVYATAHKWLWTLGFRGHFTTKSRKYSVTLGRLRRARARYAHLAAAAARSGTPIDTRDLETRLLADECEETTSVVIGHWAYAYTGWDTHGQKDLATAAATKAQEYAQWNATQKHHTLTQNVNR